MKKKIIIIVILLMLVMVSKRTVSANENGLLYITENFAVDCNSIEPLYNNFDEIVGFYFDGIFNGYAIISIEGELVEYTDNSEINEFDNDDGLKSYYSGPGEYYLEDTSSNKLVDLESNKKILKKEIQTFNVKSESNLNADESTQENNINVTNNKKSVTISYPDGTKDSNGNTTYTDTFFKTLTLQSKGNLLHDTRFFSYNTDGTCGSTASAIFIYYYYDYISSLYIKNSNYIGYTNTKQQNFVNHFKYLLNDDGNGTGYTEVENGIDKYLKSIGASNNCTYVTTYNITTSPLTKIMECINSKKPCIIGLDEDPTYGNHWVVGVGYARYYGVNGTTRGYVNFVKVNNGWYTTKSQNIVYVNYKYIDGVLYLE